jgi:adenylosuccinate lyase
MQGLDNRTQVPSTQIVPRDYLIEWAMLYQRIALASESLALFIRCGARSEIGEFFEDVDRVGSSAMPGKRNPIDSEKVCGLARVSRGHLLTLMESYALWEDRDLSNSSAERIAVPGMAATVEHMTNTMLKVVRVLGINHTKVAQNAQDSRTRTNYNQSYIQRSEKVGPLEAALIWNERQKG